LSGFRVISSRQFQRARHDVFVDLDGLGLVMSADKPLLIGESPTVLTLRAEIAAVARTDATVMILGETGVGKEVVARWLHAESGRHDRPFVAVNCSGIPDTLLESELFGHARGSFTGAYRDKAGLLRHANRGTLFLDEVGEMSLRMQAVLLRFAETGEVQPIGSEAAVSRTNVRLVTATNRDLRAQIETGQFREDLYYRLNIFQVHVPPLRERGNDIILLMRHYLERASRTHRAPLRELAPDTEQILLAYRWPGNIRELKNVAERLAVRCEGRIVRPDDIPADIRHRSPATMLPDGAAPRKEHENAAVAPLPDAASVERMWSRLMLGEDFWTVVYKPFKAREITRGDLSGLIHRGLQHTRGSYRALLRAFNLPPTDYKRFHAFLYQQKVNLAVGPYRGARATVQPREQSAAKSA
jgi:DNA-binding NtrC family response regulator